MEEIVRERMTMSEGGKSKENQDWLPQIVIFCNATTVFLEMEIRKGRGWGWNKINKIRKKNTACSVGCSIETALPKKLGAGANSITPPWMGTTRVAPLQQLVVVEIDSVGPFATAVTGFFHSYMLLAIHRLARKTFTALVLALAPILSSKNLHQYRESL